MASLLKYPRVWALAALASILLWYGFAYPRGMVMAHLDHAFGRREVKTYGYPAPWQWAYGRLLHDRYGVRLHAVAGCVVSPDLAWYADGYNEAAVGLVNREYHKDVFAECAELAQQQSREEGPGE